MDEDNEDVENIPSDGEGLDGNDDTSDESDADSDVSHERDPVRASLLCGRYLFGTRLRSEVVSRLYPPSLETY